MCLIVLFFLYINWILDSPSDIQSDIATFGIFQKEKSNRVGEIMW